MFSAMAYGLCIHSELPLPELVADDRAAADVVIRWGTIDHRLFEASGQPTEGCVYAAPGEAELRWAQVGGLLVRGGREIVVDPAPGVVPQLLRLSILGPGLGVLLHQRGLLVLHGSGVAARGGCIALVGESGAGKSTTAAALHRRGYPILADDLVPLDIIGGATPTTYPGFPQLKLWPDVSAPAGDDSPLRERAAKSYQQVASVAPDTRLPLRAIYTLAEGPEPAITVLGARAAFVESLCHTYAVEILAETQASGRHFHQCVELVRSVPIFLLERPYQLGALPEVVRLLDAHIAHL